MRTQNYFHRSTARSVAIGVGVTLLLIAASVGVASAAQLASTHDQRGRLRSVNEIAELSPSQVQAAVEPFFGDTGRVRYAVTGYRITYTTIDPRGRPTTASGLVVLP